jgi:hypothetical protein
MDGMAVSMRDWISKLERAKALLDSGALTPEEFNAEKARLLPQSAAFSDRSELSVAEDSGKSKKSCRDRLIRFAMVAALLVVVATAAYLMFASPRSEPQLNMPVTTVVQPSPAPQTATPTPTPSEKKDDGLAASQSTPVAEEATPLPAAEKGPDWTTTEQALVDRWYDLNERCRGGSGDDSNTMDACALREQVSAQLDTADICYGEEGQSGYQMEMHRCNQRSLARQ